jgi:uncharacterized membrane protein
MILGRSRVLWLALIAAALNVAVGVFHINLTVENLIQLNALAIALLGVLANEDNPTTAGTFSRTTKAPRTGSISRT